MSNVINNGDSNHLNRKYKTNFVSSEINSYLGNIRVHSPKDYGTYQTLTTLNLEDFLLNPEKQKALFKEGLHLNEFFYLINLVQPVEYELVKQKKLEENHAFFQFCLKTFLNFEKLTDKEECLLFSTASSLEKNVLPHWNLSKYISKKTFDSFLFKEISLGGVNQFKFLLKQLGIEKLVQAEHYNSKNENIKPLNLKTKTIKNYLLSDHSQRKKLNTLLNELDNYKEFTQDNEALLANLDLSTLQWYKLRNLNKPDIMQIEVDFSFDGISKKTTLENVSKYNSMEKALSNCVNRQLSYSLSGISTYSFEELVNDFNQDPFLKTVIVNFLKRKADKAVKPENRALWRFHAIDLTSTEDTDKIQKPRNKI